MIWLSRITSLLLLLFITSGILCTPEDPYLLETNELRLPLLDDGSVNVDLLASVGNGHLATNVFSDAVFVNGVYNGRLGESHRARVQSLHASEFRIVEGCVSQEPERLYRLDMRRAVFEEIISCPDVTVTFRNYAHSSLDRLLVTEVHIESSLGNVISVERSDLSGTESGDMNWDPAEIGETSFYKSGTTLDAETDDSGLLTVHVYYNGLIPSELTLDTSELQRSFIFLLAVDVDQARALQDFNDALNLASSDPSGESLRASHLENWEQTWRSGNIILEGSNVDNLLKETIASSFYYLYSSLPSFTTSEVMANFYGLSPGGLGRGDFGRDYNGHVFWDMDTWMFPPIVVFRPDLAKAMLKYRVEGMSEALKRASEGGYSGARFPWESAYTGAEVTPDICPLCRENQQHITGDISWAARTYLSVTRDLEWLTQRQPGNDFTGEEFLQQMAFFWESRPTFSEEKGQWEINEVMPPDEHQEHAHNSIYTNLVANLAVNTARWATCLASGEGEAITVIPEEWLYKMSNLVFLFNEDRRYHEEYEGFNEQYQTGNLDPRGIKQADVVLLGYPLQWDMPADVKRNDLDIYEPITNTDGPAMTWGVFAINWLELGEQERADDLFGRSYIPYVREPFKVWTETQAGVGAVNFITGAGGFLQALIFGYGGMRVHPTYLQFRNARMPPGVETLNFVGLEYLGAKFDLAIDDDQVVFNCYQESPEPLIIEFDSGIVFPFVCHESGNSPQLFPKDGFKIYYTNDPSSCDPPADVINVNY